MTKKIALLGCIIITILALSQTVNAQVRGVSPGYDPYAPIQRYDSLSPQCSADSYWHCPACANSGYGGPGCFCSCLTRGNYDPLNPAGAIRPDDPPSFQQWWYSNHSYPQTYYQPYPYQQQTVLAPLPAQAAGPGPVYPRDPAYDQYLTTWWHGLWR